MFFPTGRKTSRSWCSPGLPTLATLLLAVSYLRTATCCKVFSNDSESVSLVYAHNTSPKGTVLATLQSTNVTSASSSNSYIDAQLNSTTGDITLLTNEEFESYEITNVASTIQVAISCTCKDSSSQISYQVNVQLILLNKYSPLFIAKNTENATTVDVVVPMPLHKGYTVLGGCDYTLQAIDYGLDNSNIVFSVDKPEMFAVTSTQVNIGSKPGYDVTLTTAALLNFEQPQEVTVTATDGGKPSLKTELKLKLAPDTIDSTPPSPWFSSAVYTGEVTETMSSGDSLKFNSDITISEGYDSSMNVTLQKTDSTDWTSMFSVHHTNNTVQIRLAADLTEDFVKKPFVALVLKANRDKALKEGRTVVLLTLPGSKPVTTTTSTTITTTSCPTTSTEITTPFDCSSCPTPKSTTLSSTMCSTDCSLCTTLTSQRTTKISPPTSDKITTPSKTPDCSMCPTVSTECPATSVSASTVGPIDCSQCATAPNSSATCPTNCPQCPTVTTECPATSVRASTVGPIDCSHCATAPNSSATCPTNCSQCPTVTTECPATSVSASTVGPIDCSQCATAPNSSATCPTNFSQCPTVTTECPATSSSCAPCPTNCTQSSTTDFTTTSSSIITPCPINCSQCPATVSSTIVSASTVPATDCSHYPATSNTSTSCPIDCSQCPSTVSGTVTCQTCPDCLPVPESTYEMDCSKCTTSTSKWTSTPPSQSQGSPESTVGSSTVTAVPGLVKFNDSMYVFDGQWPCSGGSVALGVVAATVIAGDGSPTYSLEGAPDSVKVDRITGALTLQRPLVPNNYVFKAVAEWKNSEDRATVVVEVSNVDSCTTNSTKLTYNFIITDFDEEGPYNVSGSQPLNHNCSWTKVSENPPNKNFFRVWSDGTISTDGIDREDEAFSGRNMSEVLLQVNVSCSDDQQDEDQVPEDTSDSSKPWYPLKSLRTSWKEVTYLAVVNDINDNPPTFSERSVVVGYPDQQLARQLVPQSLLAVKATDKDEGLNAFIRYEIVSDANDGSNQFVIHPHSGAIYPSESAFAFKDTNFNVVAKDLDGAEGFLQSDYLAVKVRILSSKHLTVLTVEGRLVEDTDSLLDQIKTLSGMTVKVISSAVIPSSAAATRSWFPLQMFADSSPKSLLRLLAYALDTNNDMPVQFSDVKQKLEDTNLGVKFDVSQLPEVSSGSVVQADTGSNSGLVAAVATLGVLLALTIVAVVVVTYYFFFRRRRGDSDNSYDNIIRTDSSDSPSLNELPVSAYEEDIMVAYNEQLNKYDQQRRELDQDEEAAPPRKSVAFSPDVAHIDNELGDDVVHL